MPLHLGSLQKLTHSMAALPVAFAMRGAEAQSVIEIMQTQVPYNGTTTAHFCCCSVAHLAKEAHPSLHAFIDTSCCQMLFQL